MINAQRQHIDQFYATPPEVARKALEGIDLKGVKTVLDPSCGTGSFLAALPLSKSKYYGFEIDPDRHNAAKAANYGHDTSMAMLGYDFLRQQDPLSPLVDLIVMNPPFNKGASHLLHAIELMENQPKDSQIVCLLNAETISNTYILERQVLEEEIQRLAGTVKNLGQCFKRVKAEVVCVQLKIKGKKLERDWNWSEMETVRDNNNANFGTSLVPFTESLSISQGELARMVDFYNKGIAAYSYMMLAYGDLAKYADVVHGNRYRLPNITHSDTWREEFTLGAWNHLFDTCTRRQIITIDLRASFKQNFAKDFGGYAFTVENIARMFEVLMNSEGPIIEQTCKEVFEYISIDQGGKGRYKHNTEFRLNNRFKLHGVLAGCWRSVGYKAGKKLEAIDKLMCLLSGMNMDQIVSIEDRINLDNYTGLGYTYSGRINEGMETTFFRLVRFQNGNLTVGVKKWAFPFWVKANQIIGKIGDMTIIGQGEAWKIKNKAGKLVEPKLKFASGDAQSANESFAKVAIADLKERPPEQPLHGWSNEFKFFVRQLRAIQKRGISDNLSAAIDETISNYLKT